MWYYKPGAADPLTKTIIIHALQIFILCYGENKLYEAADISYCTIVYIF